MQNLIAFWNIGVYEYVMLFRLRNMLFVLVTWRPLNLKRLLLVLAVMLAPNGSIAQADSPDLMTSCGPIRNAGMEVVVDRAGVHAVNYRFRNNLAKKSPWQARWIAAASKESNQSAATLFRKEFKLENTPRQVLVWITTDGHYRLYINGKIASRGPADSGRDYTGMTSGRHFYDCRNLTTFFHAGQNTVAVEVLGGKEGLLFEADIKNVVARVQTMKSDETWRALPTPHLFHANWQVPPGEKSRASNCLWFDGRKEPVGWLNSGFDDSTWPLCRKTVGVSDPLVASELPPLMEARYPPQAISRASSNILAMNRPFENGHSITLTKDGSFAVHFDRVMTAHYGIRVKGGGGAHIAIQASERNAPGYNRMIAVSLRDGEQEFESPEPASVGTLNVIVSNVSSPVEIMDVWATCCSQPVAYRGSFECNDDQLNAIWNACRWATQINLQTHHLDSPDHQEPICDYGDYLIEDLVNYCTFAEPWLARQDLRKFAWVMERSHYQTFHTSYILLWLQTLVEYYRYTGDKSLVDELSPHVRAILDRFTSYRGKNGLMSELPNYMFMDWVNIAGFECHHPPAVIGQGYMTAFYYRALEDASLIAEWTGDKVSVEKYAGLRKEIAFAYNRELWNESATLYRDGKPFVTSVKPNAWLPADRDIETFSAQNNVLSVLYDLAPKERQKTVIEKTMAQTPWNVRPYYMHFVLNAIDHAGLFDKYGTVWMRKWNVVPETQSFYEMGDSGDLSHGWIATPLYQMSARILGITPASPGFKKISIRPHLCDLLWARGQVPTLHGNVAVSWRRVKDQLTLDVTIPRGTTSEISVPVGGSMRAKVQLDGKMIWSADGKNSNKQIRRSGDALMTTLSAGKHSFTSFGF